MLGCALATCRPLVKVLRDIAQQLRNALLASPDQALVRARVASERLVASVRLAIATFLVISNLIFLARGGGGAEFVLTMSGVAIGYSGVLFLLARRGTTNGWIPWVASSIDVSLGSLVIAQFAFGGFPLAALNNRVMFEWYFVAVTLAALRFDWRLCAYTTLLAIAQFLGIFAYVAMHWDVSSLKSEAHGVFIPVQLTGRMIMLTGHGAGTVALALWARHLRLMIGTDQLTGLLQRRPFYERIEEELERADVGRTQLSVAIFDLDQFKHYNDRLGHLAGDRALQKIGEQLRKAVRTTDLVARYGGEEFVIAFPRMDVSLATRRAEALRAEIAGLGLEADGALLTISGGVASWPADGQSFEEVLRRADERLYGAKAAGRNLVIGPFPVSLRSAGDGGV